LSTSLLPSPSNSVRLPIALLVSLYVATPSDP
jgi:hypothetical protein